MKLDILIENGLIVTYENDFVPFRASLGIRDGKIEVINLADKFNMDNFDIVEIIDAKNKVIMPGLFNNHCHGDMTMARGLGDNLTLFEQNEKFASHNWFFEFTSEQDRYLSRQLTYTENILNGVTFITENMYWSLGMDSITAMKEVGIKGALVEDIRVDFTNPKTLISNSYIKMFTKKCIENELIPVIGGISEEDFDKSFMEEINKKVENFDLYHTSHLAENEWRHKLITDKFGISPLEFMHETNTLGKKYLGSHVVKVNEQDIKRIKVSKSHVVSTPICELKIVDGIAPISLMLKEGINVSLGTDGALWNNDNDIFKEMKQTALLQAYKYGIRSISHKDILRMATINGATTYGLENQYGSICVGKKASLIMLDIDKISWQPVRENDFENITSNLVFNTTGEDVTDVFIDGKHLVKNKKLITMDVYELQKNIAKVSEKIVNGLNRKIQEGIL